MPTTRANMYVDQGTDYLVNIGLTSDDGEPFVATNYNFFCDVRKLYSSTLAFSANCTIVESANNSFDLYIDPDQTKNLDPGKYQYDIFMQAPSGSLDKILEGLLFILPSITKVE